MKKVVKKTARNLRSVEHFNHFRCASCDGWWGIGDAPVSRKKWFCPWCGKEQLFTYEDPYPQGSTK